MGQEHLLPYLDLIRQLLTCPNGKEIHLLRQNADLVDLHLVQLMQEVGQQYGQHGEKEVANFLYRLATKIAARAQYVFVKKITDSIAETRGESEPVTVLLDANPEHLNEALPSVVEQVFRDMHDQFPEFHGWLANVIATLGNILLEYPRGMQRRIHIMEGSIRAYSCALEIFTREAWPEYWAVIQNNLAIALTRRVCGDRAENLERAIDHFEIALEVYTREAFPKDWASTLSNLSDALYRRPRGPRAENLERAIRACDAALEVRTREAFPIAWAATQNNRGNALRERMLGDRVENLEQAIQAYEAALAWIIHEPYCL